MYFSFGFYFATAFVLVQGQEFTHEEPNPHSYSHFGHCRTAMAEYRANLMNEALAPRDRQVILNPEQGWEFEPKTVTVKRCIGKCPLRYSPMPSRVAPKSFVINRRPEGTKDISTCVSVTVQEHLQCRCKCMKNETHCNERQIWDEPNCICRCRDEGIKKSECEAGPGMVWIGETCSCECRPNKIMNCPQNMTWDATYCRCI